MAYVAHFPGGLALQPLMRSAAQNSNTLDVLGLGTASYLNVKRVKVRWINRRSANANTRSPRSPIRVFRATHFRFARSHTTVAVKEPRDFNLPDQFERKLNLTRGGLCGCDEPRTGNGLPALVEDREVVGRRGKIRVVENVEKLRPELSVEVL
jgi:hypothetical protein